MKNILSLSLCIIYLTSNGQSWLLNGTPGTNSSTNFIGTTDNVSLVFKVNNRFSGTIQNATPYNTYFGYESGVSNTTGYWNVGIGHSALKTNTTGYVNTAVGVNALLLNTIGNHNQAFGESALLNNTIGNSNIGIGVHALFTNTTGNSSIAIGCAALQSSTSSNNIGIGHQAGASITSGRENCLVGSVAGYNITTGSNNACVGQQAGSGNSSGNSVLGVYALTQPGNTGGNNNAIGNLSMYKNTTGTNNCAFGREAMYYKSTGDRNIAIGNRALFNATACSDNIVIGFESMLSSAAGSGNVIIGNYTLPTQAISNTYWLDNGNNSTPLIYGNFSTRRIGLGTITPTEKLDIVGNIRFTGALMPNNSPGIDGQTLISKGPNLPPVWKTISGGGNGTVTSVNPGTNMALTAGTPTENPTLSVIPVPIFVGAGIGTGSVPPTQLLQLQGNTGSGTQLYINTTSGSPGMTLGNNANINSANNQCMFAMSNSKYDIYANSEPGDGIINSKTGRILFGFGASSGTSGAASGIWTRAGLSIGDENISLPNPTARLHVTGYTNTNSTYCIKFDNADGDSLLHITDGGLVTGVIEGREYTPTLTNAGNVSLSIVNQNTLFTRIGSIVDAEYSIQVTPIKLLKACYLYVTLPIKTKKSYSVIGEGAAISGSDDPRVCVIASENTDTTFMVSFIPVIPTAYVVNFHIKYAIY